MSQEHHPTLDYHSPDDPPPTNESLRTWLACALTFLLLIFLDVLFIVGAAWVARSSRPFEGHIMITSAVFCLLVSLGLYLLVRQKSWGFLKGVLIGRFIVLVLEALCYFKLYR